MKLFVQCLNQATRDMYYGERNYSDDSGFDLYCPNDITVSTTGITEIDLGIRCWTPDKVGYMLVPRSSIYKYNLMLANSIGIIDAGYTGNIRANVVRYNNRRDIGHPASSVLVFMSIFLSHMMFSPVFPISLVGTFIAYFIGILSVYKRYENNIIFEGTRLFQLVAFDGKPIDVEFVDELPEEANTERGDNGFGSTDLADVDSSEEESSASNESPRSTDSEIEVEDKKLV